MVIGGRSALSVRSVFIARGLMFMAGLALPELGLEDEASTEHAALAGSEAFDDLYPFVPGPSELDRPGFELLLALDDEDDRASAHRLDGVIRHRDRDLDLLVVNV